MRTLYRQLLSSMLLICITVPIVILLSFNFAMRTNVEMTAKEELENTIATMQNLIETSNNEDDESALLNRLAAALTSAKLSGNTNFYIVNDNIIRFSSENNFNVSDDIVISVNTQDGIYRQKINGNRCYVRAIKVAEYDNGDDAKIVFVTNTKNSMDNLRTTNMLLISIIIVSLAGSIIYAVRTSKNIIKPIRSACDYANEVGNGVFTKEIHSANSREIEELYTSLNHMAKKLKENEDNQKAFYQNISHEFRNPLMSIQGYAEGIERGILQDSAKSAHIIIKESAKLNDMVSQLLLLSRMDSNMYHINMESYNLKDMVLYCVQSVNGIAIQKGVKLHIDVNEKVKVKLDEDLFSKAAVNIITNCIKYAHQNVWITGKQENDKVIVEIYDDGDGTNPDNIPHLFERFYKGESGNFGLGLAIAKEAIELMDGSISVVTTDSVGETGRQKIKFMITVQPCDKTHI